MADMTRFWEGISKLGDQISQLSIYNYQQKREEERLNRERDVAATREMGAWTKQQEITQKEHVNEIEASHAFDKELVGLRTQSEIKLHEDVKKLDAQSNAFLGDPTLARAAVGAAFTKNPGEIQRIASIFDGIKTLKGGGQLTPAHRQAIATLGPIGQQGAAELEQEAKKTRQVERYTESQIQYVDYLRERNAQEGKLTPSHYIAQEKEISDSLEKIMKLKQLPLYGEVHSYLDKNQPLPEALKSAAESLAMEEGLMVQDYHKKRIVLGLIGKTLGYPSDQEAPPPPPDSSHAPAAGISLPTERKENFGQGIARVAGDIGSVGASLADKSPGEIVNAISSAGGRGQAVLQNLMPMEPTIPSKIDMALRKQYSVPEGGNIHYAQGGKILTKQGGKDVVMKRDDLRLIARPGDFLWDSETGTMFQLGLYLNQKGQTPNKLDTEDEIFPEGQ